MNKLHVTICISARNEEANIGRLLNALGKQKRTSFILDKILVVSDGSTDNTVNIIKKVSKQYPFIDCLNDPIRRGVRYRTQQFLKLNKSDILIFFDGDTLPGDSSTLSCLVEVFKNDTKTILATANILPVPPTSVFERMHFAWRSLWSAITIAWKDGDNIYNFRGVGIAIRKDFAKKLQLPDNITSVSSHYIYLSAKQRHLKTAFCPKAIIYYRLAKTLKDYSLQFNRGRKDSFILKPMFTTIYKSEYLIPKNLKYKVLLKRFVNKPIETIVALVFNLAIPLINKDNNPSDHNGAWDNVKSTSSLV